MDKEKYSTIKDKFKLYLSAKSVSQKVLKGKQCKKVNHIQGINNARPANQRGGNPTL